MPERAWSNDQLRTFLIALRSGGIFDAGRDVDDADRVHFRREAANRIVPEVVRRVLADVGAVIDPRGVAAVALEILEEEAYGAKHTWLMVTEDPWSYLTDLVAHEITRSYRSAVRRRSDDKVLSGIESASSRREIE
ncbi:hypothetical protein [Microbacterium capsulatum]|uniref:Uncharacterized protein n=1 Tax=Microbacterium capsulatum TaxID=3041921 RepID=A0ABU0XJ08_9MICO|nr:hypothetical protein [Microbacterium sp. ASV81]MDQ4215091.1 hypothetical protein [Microbacterium sp. ASV81]